MFESPPLLNRLAGLSWRLLLVVAVLALAGYVLAKLLLILVPLALALMLLTLLIPVLQWLRRRGLPHPLAAGLTLVGALLLVIGLAILIIPIAVTQSGALRAYLPQGVETLQHWLTTGPFQFSPETVDDYTARIRVIVHNNWSFTASRVLSNAALGMQLLAGAILSLLMLIYFLIDGERIARGLVGLVPADHRELLRALSRRAWQALNAYVRGLLVMGIIDTVVIGAALFFAGVPLVLPLALLVFVAAFIPVVGWLLATGVIVLVTLADGGLTRAAVVLFGLLLFYFIEGNILTPRIIGRASNLHPLVTILVLTAGGTLGGIPGAFIAVPLTAVGVAVVREIRARQAAASSPPASLGVPAAQLASLPPLL